MYVYVYVQYINISATFEYWSVRFGKERYSLYPKGLWSTRSQGVLGTSIDIMQNKTESFCHRIRKHWIIQCETDLFICSRFSQYVNVYCDSSKKIQYAVFTKFIEPYTPPRKSISYRNRYSSDCPSGYNCITIENKSVFQVTTLEPATHYKTLKSIY